MRLWRRKPAVPVAAVVPARHEVPRWATDRAAATAYIDAAIRRHEQGRRPW